MATNLQSIETQCINVIRGLAMDGPQKADSGHPGTAMACAPIGWSLYGKLMRHNPANPDWVNRDRFVLSCGHACILQYSLLHLTGYALTRDDLIHFRQWESKTPGHPENFLTPGVETTTGPLGQGFAHAVGMALAERFLASHFNRPDHQVVDHYTYVLASDGDLMEGVSAEASSIAGHLQLGKLVVLWDDNHITIEGDTELAFSENVDDRYRAYGWHVQRVDDVNDLEALNKALENAKSDPRPSFIAVRTHIAYPAPTAQDTAEAHGSPLGDEEIAATKKLLGLPPDQTFYIPDEVSKYASRVEQGQQWEKEWRAAFEAYRSAHPELAAQFEQWMEGRLPEGWDADLPTFKAGESVATRNSSGKVINALAPKLGNLIGGSADLAGSTKTLMSCTQSQSAAKPAGRNMHFGIREHAMAAMVNGMSLHGGLIPYGATFFVFTDYMRPSLRLAALMGVPAIHVLTHDSIGLGEDGPTHQPIEHLAAMRAIPNFTIIRPADANEVREAWRVAITKKDGPVGLVLTRQNVPTFDRSVCGAAEGLAQGAYVLAEAEGGEPRVVLIGTGSEVSVCMDARELLQQDGIPTRVVSMPSWELFEAQEQRYRDSVLPPSVTARVAVEAGCSFGWQRYVGSRGACVCIDHFGASAPWQTNMEKFGFTKENVAATARKVLE
ncbi:MAG: transketolase [Vulcanimicrobiota bacterium]